MSTTTYIPGVCNIGFVERQQRKLFGWIGMIVTIVLGVVLIAFHAAPAWRLLLFFPATVGTIGYLQFAWHFCARFGLNGVFNFGPSVGKTDTIEQAEFRQKDRQKALQIIGLSTLTGGVVALVAYLLPV